MSNKKLYDISKEYSEDDTFSDEDNVVIINDVEIKEMNENKKFNEEWQTRKKIVEQIKQEKHQQKELEIAERLKKYDEERLELFEKINTKAQLFKDFFGSKQAREALLYGVAIKYTVDTIKEGSEAFNDFRKEGLTVGQSFNELGKDLGLHRKKN